jgi:hypothetical protein
MKLNGRDIGSWQVVTKTLEEFNETFNKLKELGFVYASERLKTCEEINRNYGWYATIIIGNDSICKAVLHGRNFPRTNIPVVTIEDFIANYYPAFWAA